MTAVDILILDDEVEFGQFVKDVAEYLGMAAKFISDPYRFKELYTELLPAVVVLDIAMPGLDGMQLVQWLGQYARDHDTTCRLIIVSGYGPDQIRLCSSIAALSGLKDVEGFSKPIEADALASVLSIKAQP